MKAFDRLTIAQTACISGLGGLLSASGFLLLMLLRKPLRSGDTSVEWFAGVGFIVLLIGGLVLSLWAESSINNGIAAARWPEDRIEALRRILRSPWSVALSVVVLVVFLVCCFVVHQRGIGWMVFLLGQTLSRLAIAVRVPAGPRDDNPLTKWRTWSSIRSDHWGQR
jgi:E3 ubiquitin-protein ligase DOA10